MKLPKYNLSYNTRDLIHSLAKSTCERKDEISIFGQQKHLILGIQPRDFLKIFLRFWTYEPHFPINSFLTKNKRAITNAV